MSALLSDASPPNRDGISWLDEIEMRIGRIARSLNVARECGLTDLADDLVGSLTETQYWLLMAAMMADGELRARIAALVRRINAALN